MRPRAALLTLLAGTALAVPAGSASASACPGSTAVTVVVDFASLGGGEQTRCTGSDPSSGLAALRAAGFTPTRAAQVPGYFVCRIDARPASDPCQRTSPSNAYWSYWHAKRGGSWTYSSVGAADYDPPPGTVEGWAFGAGKPPSSRPPAAASSPSPAATARASAHPQAPAPAATRPPTPATAVAAAAGTPTAAAAPPAGTARSTLPTAVPHTTPSTATGSASPAAPALPTAAATGPGVRHSSRLGPAVAAVVVLLLGGAAVQAATRRRRTDQG
jgi:hypothetical protein